MAEVPLLQIVDTITDLKALSPVAGMRALLIGKTAISDGLGGFYRWDTTDTTSAEDTTFMNVIPSSASGAFGRWVRMFQKARNVGGGVLVINGGVKSFFVSGTTASNGKVTLNLTDDGTSTGNALFNEIWSISASPQTSATGPADAVQSYRESLTTNLKTCVYGFYKANAVTVAVGLLIVPVASIGAGTTIQFQATGI